MQFAAIILIIPVITFVTRAKKDLPVPLHISLLLQGEVEGDKSFRHAQQWVYGRHSSVSCKKDFILYLLVVLNDNQLLYRTKFKIQNPIFRTNQPFVYNFATNTNCGQRFWSTLVIAYIRVLGNIWCSPVKGLWLCLWELWHSVINTTLHMLCDIDNRVPQLPQT